ncbi:hypothetical protein CCZ01_08640, partial [Helicobacter monodelphidis]|uniref:methyl-accepting chemotaxis protein n=1 Tax=Helicobacter sp. 15-1451 TaxID=2004995 RepID=UPI000DCD1138
MNSVKMKLAVIGGGLVVIVLVALAGMTFVFNKITLESQILESQKNYISMGKLLIDDFSLGNTKAVEGLASIILELPIEKLNSQEAIMENVGPILRSFREGGAFFSAGVGLSNGELIVSDTESDAKKLSYYAYGAADSYDARTRDWYKETYGKEGMYISPTYIDALTGFPCFTYAISLTKDGQFIGVLSVDVLVLDLQSIFEQLPVVIFALDKDKQPFVSSDVQIVKKESDSIEAIKKQNLSIIYNLAKQIGDYNYFVMDYQKPDTKQVVEKFGICVNTYTGAQEYTICTIDDNDKINAPIYAMAAKQGILLVVASIFSVILLFFIVGYYLKPLAMIQKGLQSFFAYLNYESRQLPQVLSCKGKDEFGTISTMINENIQQTNINLDIDAKLVKESLEVVEFASKGSASKRISLDTNNPQLKELRNALNGLLEVLEKGVGSDLVELNRVFDSYATLDFTTEVTNAKGRVEIVTNTLGHEIKKMLSTSAGFAQELESKSKELESTIQRLLQGSNTQASSL